MGKEIFDVNYVTEKVFHVDLFLEAALLEDRARQLFNAMLLTKTERWKPEEEVRIITERQDVHMRVGSVTEVMFGKNVEAHMMDEIINNINSHFHDH